MSREGLSLFDIREGAQEKPRHRNSIHLKLKCKQIVGSLSKFSDFPLIWNKRNIDKSQGELWSGKYLQEMSEMQG